MFFAFLVFSNSFLSIAQSDSLVIQTDSIKVSPHHDILSAGFGMGLDYGGFGLNALVYPHYNVGVFAGFGYALVHAGYNVGIRIRLSSEKKSKKVIPFLTAMYGYNAVIKVKIEEPYSMMRDRDRYNRIYYGATLGFGLDVKSAWPGPTGYWTFALLVPIRSSEVYDYIDKLENNNGVDFKQKLFPIAISIGYRVIIGRSKK